jgi:hypothetical protein
MKYLDLIQVVDVRVLVFIFCWAFFLPFLLPVDNVASAFSPSSTIILCFSHKVECNFWEVCWYDHWTNDAGYSWCIW